MRTPAICHRETQESVCESIIDFLKRKSFPWVLNSVSEIWPFVDSLPEDNIYNSSVCAIEMSLLDLLGKDNNKPIVEYFPKDFYANKIYYGAPIPIADKNHILKICRFIKKMKINKLKLKMGKDFIKNKEAFETVDLVFGEDCDLKIDINGVWDLELALKHTALIKQYNVRVVEQPMMPGDRNIAEFARFMQNNGVILMADESACSLKDVEHITQESHYRMVNVRLSKCGGFRRSLKIIDHLRMKGFSFQVAAHLGESGLLSAAGRALSLLCRDAVYYDGSYDEFLLEENLTVDNVSFGLGGEAVALDAPGLGVGINRQSIERLGTHAASVSQ